MNELTRLLGIKYPILQGAMAQISMSPLVSAVSNAGGLGIIATGGLTVEKLRAEIIKTKQLTNQPFAVNLMLMMSNCDEMIEVIIELGVKIVTTGAGTPKPYMSKLKAAGIIVIPVVPSVKLAKKMEALGVDAIVVEGTEAGGHIGEVATMPLVASVTKNSSIPVIAAGGISDAKGLAASFALGAVGVQMGTVFLASKECPIPEVYKEKIVIAQEIDTVVTGRSQGSPVRGIKNELTTDYLELEKTDINREELEALTMGSLRKAVVEGDMRWGSVMAGQIVGNIDEIKNVETIIETIVKEYQTIQLPNI